jgi:hypothetical protein
MFKKIKELLTKIFIVPLMFLFTVFIYIPYYHYMKWYEKRRKKREESLDSVTLVVWEDGEYFVSNKK